MTCLRSGGIFSDDDIIAYLPLSQIYLKLRLSLTVKEFLKSPSTFGKVTGRTSAFLAYDGQQSAFRVTMELNLYIESLD